MKVAHSCLARCDPMDYTVHGILQSKYWNGRPFPSPGDLPNLGIKPRSPTLQVDSFPAELSGKLFFYLFPNCFLGMCLIQASTGGR